jgi:hypothetical protein
MQPGRDKSSAERMRLLRLRRRDGVDCCITVEVFGYEIEEMVRQGLLQRDWRQDRWALKDAVGKIIEAWYRQS